MSLPLSLDKKDALNILKHAGYGIGAMICATGISLLSTAHVEPQYMWLIPFLLALFTSVEKFFQNSASTQP